MHSHQGILPRVGAYKMFHGRFAGFSVLLHEIMSNTRNDP